MREKLGYRDVLCELRSRYGELLTVAQVSEFTGVHPKRVGKQFSGWQGEHKGKRMPAVVLARQLV